MKKTVPVLLVALFFAAVSLLQAQSLADVAEKEKQRREEIGETPKTITNDAVTGYSGGSVSTATPESSRSAAPDTEQAEQTGEETVDAEEAEEAGKKADSEEPSDFEGRPESYWRETMGAARQKVKDLEQESTVLTLRMNDLENRFYNIDDGFDRDSIQKDIQKAYYEIDLNKENLAKAKDELQELENEARKSGALPGWIE
jgi:chromosome segregation ATPase